MKCTCCGSEMKQLFTSWYCPSCKGGNTSDVKETPDSSRKPKWDWCLWGTIKKVEHHLLGYRIEFGTYTSVATSMIIKKDEIISDCQLLDFLAGNHQDGYTLCYRKEDKQYCIAQPGWYWENSKWKYDEHRWTP